MAARLADLGDTHAELRPPERRRSGEETGITEGERRAVCPYQAEVVDLRALTGHLGAFIRSDPPVLTPSVHVRPWSVPRS